MKYPVGLHRPASSADENGKRNSHKYKDISEQTRKENNVPAIITKEKYDKAMERKKAKKRGSNSAKRNYLLSGIIKCGKCGSDMTGNARSEDKGAYRCQKKNGEKCNNKSIGQDVVEDFVLHLIKESLISDKNLAELTRKVKNFLDEKKSDYEKTVKDMDKNISELERKKSRFIDKISEDIQPSEDYEKKVKEINEELDELKKGMEEYIAENKIPVVDEQSVKKAIEKFTDKIKGISPETSKNFIKKYIKEVRLTPTDVEVIFM